MIIDISIFPLSETLEYEVPQNLEELVNIGALVTVPLGKRTSRGYLVGIKDERLKEEKKENDKKEEESSYKIKKIINIEFNGRCFFNESLLELLNWLSSYYNISLSRVIDTALVKYADGQLKKQIILKANEFLDIKGKKQLEILEKIKENNNQIDYDTLLKDYKNISEIIKKLVEKNLIEVKESKILDSYIEHSKIKSSYDKEVVLYEEQEKAVKIIGSDIDNKIFNPYLLYGITGSGKTEVYIELIKQALKNNRKAMLIVPEISLTPQLLDRFRIKLGENIAVLHSGVSPVNRSSAWQALLDGRCNFAIGARSAVFAPLDNLGVVIVDEEHDSSFKQNDSFRYNGRDVAIMRAKFSNCPVVLGSATPSLETYYNVVKKKYRKLSLNKRFANHQKLIFEVVNLNKIKTKEMTSSNISPQLYEAIKETVEKGEQAFILYNKRGFASFLQCDSCGATITCPNCSISMTYHQHRNILKCHQCDYTMPFLEKCPACKEKGEEGLLIKKGSGTEKVFDELKALFPECSIGRLDRDFVTTLKKYESILQDVRDNKINILVGTQMIAKGHDIPNVSLVAVVDCDVSLYFPDFRATERAYQLFTQVAGRAGRGDAEGKVVLQTRNPEHIAIDETVKANYYAFANAELRLRKEMSYPPFSFLARIVILNNDTNIALNDIMLIREKIIKYIEHYKLKIQSLGPAPAPIQKIKNQYRWHIILKSQTRKDLNIIVNIINKDLKINSKTKVIIDIDPQDML